MSVIFVTGAASGIGAALCESFVNDGAHVVACDVNESALRAQPWAGRADCRTLDVTDADAVATAIGALDRLDVCINNAGIVAGGAFEAFDLATLRRVIDVNLFGVLNGTHAAYRRMTAQGSGHIVNLASMAGLHAVPYSAAYTAAKHGVVGLSLALREEGRRHGVRVSAVCPGLVDTGIFGASHDRGSYSYRDVVNGVPGGKSTARDAAAAIRRGIARNDALVIFPESSRLLAVAHRIAPSLIHRAIGRVMRA
jgi:NAD(P)-dependent dehydrogenase (short-subunit alcohol dehydrogenase family)